MILEMRKEDCIHCGGSGWVTPFPYHRRKRCNHRWDSGTILGLISGLKEKQAKTEELICWYEAALKNSKEVQ